MYANEKVQIKMLEFLKKFELLIGDKELVQSLVFDANITQVFNIHKLEVLNK